MEAMKQGCYSSTHKKLLDEYYEESEEFRALYPNYEKWQGDYEDF